MAVCFGEIPVVLLQCFSMSIMDEIKSMKRIKFKEFYEQDADTLILGASPAQLSLKQFRHVQRMWKFFIVTNVLMKMS